MVIFKKRVDVNTKNIGTLVKDGFVSPIFTSIYDNELEMFPTFELTADRANLEKGQAPIGSTYASGKYLCEFPVPTSPQYGSAELHSVNLNIHAKDLDYNHNYNTPELEIYKFKSDLPSGGSFAKISVGPVGSSDAGLADQIIVGNGTYSEGPRIFESFEGHSDGGMGAGLPSLWSAANNLDDRVWKSSLHNAWQMNKAAYWNGDDADAGCLVENDFFIYYGSYDENDNKVVYFILEGEDFIPRDWEHSDDYFDRDLMIDVPAFWSARYDWSMAVALGKTSSFKKQRVGLVTDASTMLNPTDPDVSLESDINKYKITTDNTFFDDVRYTANRKDYDDILTSITAPIFTTEGAPSNGQALRLYSNITPLDSQFSTKKWGTTHIGYDSIMLMKQIPKPLPLAKIHGDSDKELGSMRIRIKFQIQTLTKMCKSGKQSASDTDTMDGNTLMRSLVFMLGSRRPMEGGETMGSYIHRMNSGKIGAANATTITGDADEGKYTSDDFTLVQDVQNQQVSFHEAGLDHTKNAGTTPIMKMSKFNNYNGIAIMKVPSDEGDGTSPTTSSDPEEGKFFMFHTGKATDRFNFFDGYYAPRAKNATGAGGEYNPFIIRNGVGCRYGKNFPADITANDGEGSASSSAITSLGPHGDSYLPLEDDESGAKFSANTWHYLDAYINHTPSYKGGYTGGDGTYYTMTGNDGVQGYVTWVISDTSEKVIAATTQVHSGGGGDTGATIDHPTGGGYGGSDTTLRVSNVEFFERGDVITINDTERSRVAERLLVLSPPIGHASTGVGNITVVRAFMGDGSRTINHGHNIYYRAKSYSNSGDGYPCYLSIWLNNAKVGIAPYDGTKGNSGVATDTHGEKTGDNTFWNDDEISSVVDVLIDNIEISNFQPKLHNITTSGWQGSRSSITVNSTYEDNLFSGNTTARTDYGEGVFQVGEPIPKYENTDGSEAPTPTYLSWGAKRNVWQNTDNNSVKHIFMGGYTTSTPSLLDASDSTKRIKYGITGRPDIRFFTHHSHAIDTETSEVSRADASKVNTSTMGFGITESGNEAVNVGHHLNPFIDIGRSTSNTKDRFDNRIDSFTKKGFLTVTNPQFDADGTGSGTDGAFHPRENVLFSTKITKLLEPYAGKIEVVDVDALRTFIDDEFVIYRAGHYWENKHNERRAHYYRRGLYIKSLNSERNTIVLEARKTGVGKSSARPIYSEYHDTSIGIDDSYSDWLLHDNYLSDLYISPLRYWLNCEIVNRDEDSGEPLPDFSYSHSLLCSSEISPDATIPGFTHDESLYSDTQVDSNKWIIQDSEIGLLERRVDYGFGTFKEDSEFKTHDEESGVGYINKVTLSKGYNNISLKGLVDAEASSIIDTKKITLILHSSKETLGAGTLISTKYDIPAEIQANGQGYKTSLGSTIQSLNEMVHTLDKPYLTFEYKDDKPTISKFEVKPYEEDPFYPEYSWECGDDDLWYGFIILDNESISHQYHKAYFHLPLNEIPSGAKRIPASDAINDFAEGLETFVYPYVPFTGTTPQGTTVTNYLQPPYTTTRGTGSGNYSTNLKSSEEGLAGNCLKFSGHVPSAGGVVNKHIMEKLVFNPPESMYLDTSELNEMSVVAHFQLNSVTDIDKQYNDKAYIINAPVGTPSRNAAFSIWVDSTGRINASVYTDDETTEVILTSKYVSPENMDEPVCVILTVDSTIQSGNVKLFINGKLEDTTGVKNTDGTVNNWKIGQSIQKPNSYIRVGYEAYLPGSGSGPSIETNAHKRNFFNGRIEEIVVYNHAIYPVNPSSGKLVITKPMAELTDNSEIAGGRPIVAKLFIKDYHNIRGTTKEEVCQSSQITIKKSGLGLKTSS